MPMKATDFQKGIVRNAGKDSPIPAAGTAPRGSRGIAKPLRYDKVQMTDGASARHASHMADDGGTILGQPVPGETKQYK